MKDKLLKTLLVLSLCVTGSLFAKDGFSAFYPERDTDSPSYVTSDNLQASTVGEMDEINLDATTIDPDQFKAFYPERDSDSPSYAEDTTLDFDNLPATASGGMEHRGIKSNHMDKFKAFYPESDYDSAQY